MNTDSKPCLHILKKPIIVEGFYIGQCYKCLKHFADYKGSFCPVMYTEKGDTCCYVWQHGRYGYRVTLDILKS